MNKLIELDIPNGDFKNEVFAKSNESIQSETDVGLVISPCTKFIAWWNRDLLLIYDGPNVAMTKKGLCISFLLWNLNGSKILVICKSIDGEGSHPVLLLDSKTGGIQAEGEIKIESDIIGCFWCEVRERAFCIISKDCIVTMVKIDDQKMFPLTALSFFNTYKSITSYLTISGIIYFFGTSRSNGQPLTTIWKLSAKYPYFFSQQKSTLNPNLVTNGIFNRLWRIIFGKPSIEIAADAVIKSSKFLNGFMTLSKNGFLSYFSNLELKWSKNVKKRFNLDPTDQISGLSFLSEDSYIISTSSGKIFRDHLSNSSQESYSYPFSLKTIFAVEVLRKDRIYIHDHFLKVLLEYSPDEMLESHMINHQYEEAYELAVKFNLNSDYVMKAKWEDSKKLNTWDISILERIEDRKWVLDQCINPPFPNSFILIKKLINYGLSLTNHISTKAIEDELEHMLEKLESSSSPTKSNSSISIMEFYMYRIQFFKRLDLLCTFEAIFGSEILKSGSGFNLGGRFADFLKISLIDFAISQADAGSISNLKILFTRNGSKLLPFRLSLLQRLPLTIPPMDLEDILPSSKKWCEIPWRKSDWAETKDLMEFAALIEEDGMNSCLEQNSYPESLEDIKQWYKNRINKLIEDIGQISFARSVCEIASSKGMDMGDMTLKLGLLECARKEAEYQAISLNDLNKIPPEKILKLVLSSCDLENASFFLLNVLHPYLMTMNPKDSWISELKEGLLALCLKDLKFLSMFMSLGFSNPSLVDFLFIPDLIKRCAYREGASPDLNFWRLLTDDFDEREKVKSSSTEGWGVDVDILDIEDSSAGLDTLKEVIHDLKDYISIAIFLERHGISWNLLRIQRLKIENSNLALSKLLRQSKILADADDQTWNDSLNSILNFVRKGLLNQVSETMVYTEFIVYAFSEAKFQFIQQLLFSKSDVCPLSFETIELLAVNAAVEYFDNDQEGDQSKGLMKLSRTCCALLKPMTKSIKEHLDLIDATDILVGQYHIKNDAFTYVLPIQIRLHKDRIQFLKLLLIENPVLYKKKDLLNGLLKKLIGDTAAVTLRSQYILQIYAAHAALKLSSFDDAFEILLEISEKTLIPDSLQTDELGMFWSAIKTLATSPYDNTEGKVALLSIAVTKSTASNISSLLPAWRETFVLSKFQKHRALAGKTISDIYTHLKKELATFASLSPQNHVDFSLKGRHDFYKPVGSSIGDFYSERELETVDQNFEVKSINQLVHLLGLLNQIEGPPEFHLKSILPNLLSEDLSLAFSYMIVSRFDAEELIAIFDTFSTNPELAAYFFSLKASLLMPTGTFNNDPFSLSMDDLPKAVFSVKNLIPRDIYSYNEIATLIDVAKLFFDKTKSVKVSQLREILVSLLDADPKKIQSDENYRKEKIIELGRTNVWKTLEKAVELANEEGVAVSKIWVAHALWLFSNNNNGPDSNYEDSRSAILTHFSAFEPYLSSVHSNLVENNSILLSRFYSLVQNAYAEKKIQNTSAQDINQLSLRVEILDDLKARGIHNHITLKQLLQLKESGLNGYMKIWIDLGDYIGLESFVGLLDKWILLSPINILKESFYDIELDHSELKSGVISQSVLHFVSKQPWESLDLFSINSILEDAFQTFPSMIPQHLEELVLSILSKTNFETKTRKLILTHAFPFVTHSQRLEKQRDLVNLLIKLQNSRDCFGNMIPINMLEMINSLYCKDMEMIERKLMEICATDFSPKLMEIICSEVNLNALDIYESAVQKSLREENKIAIEILLIALQRYENQGEDFKFENDDGWGIDDEIEDEIENDQFIVDLKAIVFENLERFSLQEETASHSFKIEILRLLEKYFAAKGTLHLQDAKLESLVLANWNIKASNIEDRSLSSLFPLVLEDTTTAMQSLQLFELLRDWPEPPENEVWMRTFSRIFELGHINLILSLQAFSRGGSNEIDIEVQKHVLGLLPPFSNQYFLYGLLSSKREIQTTALDILYQTHANCNSYHVTYKVACCLGFLPILSRSHQEECIQSVLQFKEDPLSIPLLGIILSEYPGTTVPICRAWTGMSKGVLKGYSRWIGLEGKLIRESLLRWDSSISTSIESINQPRDSICQSVALHQLDEDKLYKLIVADRLGHAKKRF